MREAGKEELEAMATVRRWLRDLCLMHGALAAAHVSSARMSPYSERSHFPDTAHPKSRMSPYSERSHFPDTAHPKFL
jgi:hypothetical protein